MARETQSSVIERIAARSGFTEFGYIPVSGLRFSEDIRKICEGNSCRNYGTSWACPPAVGTLEECRRRVGQYDTMLLFTKKYELESSFDFEAMGILLEHVDNRQRHRLAQEELLLDVEVGLLDE